MKLLLLLLLAGCALLGPEVRPAPEWAVTMLQQVEATAPGRTYALVVGDPLGGRNGTINVSRGVIWLHSDLAVPSKDIPEWFQRDLALSTLAHEIGHDRLGHWLPENDADELAAERFALNVWLKLGRSCQDWLRYATWNDEYQREHGRGDMFARFAPKALQQARGVCP